MFLSCGACGELSEVPACPVCGAQLLVASEVDDGRAQTVADREQTAADQDQTWSDHDQTASDRNERSSQEDQQASDADLAAGGDSALHDRSATARAASSRDRAEVSSLRDQAGVERLKTAEERDQAATLRDHGAQIRDAQAHVADELFDPDASREDILLRAQHDRERAAVDRAKAADDRVRAAVEREQAAAERAEALLIRADAEKAIEDATTDELTGARTRKYGLEEMERELERAYRTGAALILAFVDVDGLKQVNDEEGHLAGDELLRVTAETLRANLRSYDLLVRYGGDEFVCAMPNVTRTIAGPRFEAIASVLAGLNAEHSITFGLAEADTSETLQELIARADGDLLHSRQSDRHPPNG
jgi:diguanylate cyclase (GGDEF)-like protein